LSNEISEGFIGDITQKCYAAPMAQFALATLGAGSAGVLLSIELGRRFRSFDELVEGAETAIPEIFADHAHSLGQSEITDCQIFFRGLVEERDGPAAYLMNAYSEASQAHWDGKENADFSTEPWKLQPLDERRT
jgi:hypothetical protein